MNLLDRFVTQSQFSSYEEFVERFHIKVPDHFNFSYDVVDVYARHDPDKRALVWCNDYGDVKNATFAELSRSSMKMANALRSLGIRKGDFVMLTLKGRFQFWPILLALHRIGAVAVPATHMLTVPDMTYRFEKANIRAVISVNEPHLLQYIDEAQRETGDCLQIKAVVDGNAPDGWADIDQLADDAHDVYERPFGNEAISNDDMLLLYFSSGTTGFPKMVVHTYTYPLGHILTAGYWQCVQDNGLHYTVADSGWAKAVWGKIYGQWICGSAVFVHDYEKFDAGVTLRKCEEFRITTFCAPPTVYRLLIKKDLNEYDLSSLKYAVTAGEPLNPEVYNRFYDQTGLRLMEGYGQTELMVTAATWPWLEPKPGSMGKPTPGLFLELMNMDGGACEAGEEGELVLHTDLGTQPGMFVGYYLDEEKTSQVWTDGYYHTGDMAWGDEDGYLWFVGRDDDIIKSAGYKIGPFEVESALMEHPAVTECAITGVPDPVRGTAVKATIVLSAGYEAGEELKVTLQQHVKSVTAPYKYPRIIEFVEELPKTISGKIRRVEIRDKDKAED